MQNLKGKTSITFNRMEVSDLEEVIALESLVFGTHPDIESYKKSVFARKIFIWLQKIAMILLRTALL